MSEWGEHLPALRQLEARGRKVTALESMPTLHPDVGAVWSAFADLSNSRTVGFDANPIAISEITAWLDMHGVRDQDTRLEWFDLIRHLDRTYLAMRREPKSEEAPKEPANADARTRNRRK